MVKSESDVTVYEVTVVKLNSLFFSMYVIDTVTIMATSVNKTLHFASNVGTQKQTHIILSLRLLLSDFNSVISIFKQKTTDEKVEEYHKQELHCSMKMLYKENPNL